MNLLLLLIAALFALGRLWIEPRILSVPTWSGGYEACAHVFVGGLFGAGLVGLRWITYSSLIEKRRFGWFCLCLGAALTIVEIVAFVVQKYL